MLPDVSEFSFGFALTNELVSYYEIALTGAPRFPTQHEEGKVGGYDVVLPRRGAPLFFQFKRTEEMVRGNASHSKVLGKPHFRMHLRPSRHSDQHALLLALEAQGHEVYYAAPRFCKYDDLNAHYLNSQIADNTSFILPSWVGPLPDARDHYVAINKDGSHQMFCSKEGRRIENIDSEKLLRGRIPTMARERAQELDSRFFLDLGDRMVDTFVQRDGRRLRERVRAQATRRQRKPDEYAREVAQMLYGCELLIAETVPVT